MSDPSHFCVEAKQRACAEMFRAFSVMLEPKHLHKIETAARQHNISKAETIRALIVAGLPVVQVVQSPDHRAYENLDHPKRVHMRFPLDLDTELRERRAELGLRLGELVRMCLDCGHI